MFNATNTKKLPLDKKSLLSSCNEITSNMNSLCSLIGKDKKTNADEIYTLNQKILKMFIPVVFDINSHNKYHDADFNRLAQIAIHQLSTNEFKSNLDNKNPHEFLSELINIRDFFANIDSYISND